MTISPFDPLRFPRYPLNNITPFTYRDGRTFLEVLEELRRYLTENLDYLVENGVALQEFAEEAISHLQDLAENSESAATDVQNIFNELQANGPVASINGLHGIVEIPLVLEGQLAVYADAREVEDGDYIGYLNAKRNEAAALDNKRIVLSGEFYLSEQWNLNGNFTVEGAGDARVVLTGDHTGINSNGADDFQVRGVEFVGTLADYARSTLQGQQGIVVTNADRVTIENCVFLNLHRAGIWATHVNDWNISNNTFRQYGYAATIVNSGKNGRFANNVLFGTGVYPVGFDFCYGLAVSHAGSSARPSQVVVTGNSVENQAWEALDTHGGVNMTFTNNTITSCETGIVATPVEGLQGSTPENVVISNNVIDAGDFPTPRQAIRLAGSEVAGSPRASGAISGNVMRGYGITPANVNYTETYVASSITITRCDGVAVTGNTIIDTHGSAINLRIVRDVAVVGNVVQGIRPELAAEYERRFIRADSSVEGYVSGNAIFESNTYYGVVSTLGNTRITGLADNSWGQPVSFVGLMNPTIDAPDASAPLTNYPYGTSEYRALSENGWPGSGVLVTHNLSGDRTVQVLYSSTDSGTARDRRRVWTGDAWGDWYYLARENS